MKEKYVMIVERGSEQLKKVNESVNTSKKFLLNGIFTEFDIENRNKRFYNAQNFIPVMNSLLERRKTLGVLFGEFDHPDVFDIAGKNASHAIESLTHNESSNRVDGSIALLSTHWGKEARAIINDGYPLFVSSRAAGVTDGNGQVQLKELFTYDIVLDPGFASAQVSVNESFGYKASDDVKYRIYEMKDGDVNQLFNTNKNDRKTAMDLTQMEQFLATEMVKLEHKIMSSITEGKTSPEEIKNLMEKYDSVNAELVKVNEYLEFLKSKVNYLVKENQKLTEDNTKLLYEINENTAYSNHLSTALNTVNKYTKEIEERLGITEKFAEHTAAHTHANILFTEAIAKETEITQQFIEHVALETELTQKFVESVAKETEIAQMFAENTAAETFKDELFLNYIGEKVDGLIGYNTELLNRIKKSSPLNENIGEEDNIQSMQSPEDFLGLPEEQSVQNNLENETPSTEAGVPEVTNTVDQPLDQPGVPAEDDTTPPEGVTEPTLDTPPTDIQPEGIQTSGSELMNALVQILGTDETGIVMEVTPDGKLLIQKSGTEEMSEPMTMEQVKVLNTDENILENVNKVLSEIKKQKVLANQQPHFFSFLSEEQVADFNKLDTLTKESVLLAMNESEYLCTEDVLRVIGTTINGKNVSYEEKIISALPVSLKEAWNGLVNEVKTQILTESKYFSLTTTADITNFWNTRTFAKALNSPEAVLIKESLNPEDDKTSFSDDFVNAFMKTVSNLK